MLCQICNENATLPIPCPRVHGLHKCACSLGALCAPGIRTAPAWPYQVTRAEMYVMQRIADVAIPRLLGFDTYY